VDVVFPKLQFAFPDCLNDFLLSQAEFNRSEITRTSAAGGGSGDRAISAPFSQPPLPGVGLLDSDGLILIQAPTDRLVAVPGRLRDRLCPTGRCLNEECPARAHDRALRLPASRSARHFANRWPSPISTCCHWCRSHQMLFVRRTHCRTESVNQQGGIKQRVREFLAKKRTAARQACCACARLDTKRAPVSVQSSTQNVVEIRIYAKCRALARPANALTREYWFPGVLTGSPNRTRTRPLLVNRRHFRGRLKGADRGPTWLPEYGFGVTTEAHRFFGPNNATDLWAVKKVSPQSMIHLTEKPVELAVRAIQYSTRQGENVLDLFGGIGSRRSGRQPAASAS